MNSRKRGGCSCTLPPLSGPLQRGGGGEPTGPVRPLALALRRSAAATKPPSTGLCVSGVRTCPPGPSLMRLGSGASIRWAKRGLPAGRRAGARDRMGCAPPTTIVARRGPVYVRWRRPTTPAFEPAAGPPLTGPTAALEDHGLRSRPTNLATPACRRPGEPLALPTAKSP